MDKIELVGIGKTSGRIEEILLTPHELKAQLPKGELKGGDKVWIEGTFVKWYCDRIVVSIAGDTSVCPHIADKSGIIAAFPAEPEKVDMLKKFTDDIDTKTVRIINTLVDAVKELQEKVDESQP